MAEDEKKINLEKLLLEGKFSESPAHDFETGLPKIRTQYRRVFYKWHQGLHILGSDTLTFVLFNKPEDISDLKIYNLKITEIAEKLKDNKKKNYNDAEYLCFEAIEPALIGERAYNGLQSFLKLDNPIVS